MGDFVEGFSEDEDEGQWDAIVTMFFIDTAEDVLEYLRTINHTLRVGGVWVNLGPLLWHHDETSQKPAPQLSMEEIIGAALYTRWDWMWHLTLTLTLLIGAAQAMGLDVGPMEEVVCDFGSNSHSMLQTKYRCGLFTATKRYMEPWVPPNARFDVGDRVWCNINNQRWAAGTIKYTDHPDMMRRGQIVPYVVTLDAPLSKMISVSIDTSSYIISESCIPGECDANIKLGGREVAQKVLVEWLTSPVSLSFSLRFKLGENVSVLCPDGTWRDGKVHKEKHHETDWSKDLVMAYSVLLSDTSGSILVQRDDDMLIRSSSGGKRPLDGRPEAGPAAKKVAT